MKRLVGVLGVLVAVLLVVGCGGGGEEWSAEDFEGLTAEELFERLEEITGDETIGNDIGDRARFRVTTVVETQTNRIERVTESVLDGANEHTVLFEKGEPVSEVLEFDGENYTRRYGDEEWDPDLDREIFLDYLFARPALFERGSTEPELTPGPSPIMMRLADETVDGEAFLRVRIGASDIEMSDPELVFRLLLGLPGPWISEKIQPGTTS